jgi:hypothetical protein
MRARIAAVNRPFYNLRQIFGVRDVSKAVKIKIYKSMVKSDGRETRAVSEMDMNILGT